MSTKDWYQILTDARRGIDLLSASRPGSGPMTERVEKRKQAEALLLPFTKVQSWPAKYQPQVDQIYNALLEV